MKTKLLKNISFSFIGRFYNIILSIIVTPYIVNKISIEQFGVWMLIESIIVYFSLMDFGLGSSFTKYIAEYNAIKDFKMISNVVSVGILFQSIVVCIVIVIAVGGQSYILEIFKLQSISDYEAIYKAFIIMLSIRMITAVFQTVITGILRYDILNKVRIATSTINFLGLYLFVSAGYGLKGIAINSIIYATMDLVIFLYCTINLVPHFKINFSKELVPLFKKLFSFGINIQIVSVAELVNAQIDKIFLGMFRTASIVGLYEIGSKIANLSNIIPTVVLPILQPTASDINATSSKENVDRLYLEGTKIMATIMIPITIFVIVYADQIITLWMGSTDYTDAATAAKVLIIGITSYMIVGVGRLVARGTGVPQYEMQAGLIITISNLILSYFWIKKWGLYGAIFASALSSTGGSVFFMMSFNHKRKIDNLRVLKFFFEPFLFSIVSIIPTIPFDIALSSKCLQFLPLRLQLAIHLVTVSLLFGLIYLLCLYKSGFLKEYNLIGHIRGYIKNSSIKKLIFF